MTTKTTTKGGDRVPRDRPMLFTGDMVLAILAGTKTQTRRIEPFTPDEHRAIELLAVRDGVATYKGSTVFTIGPRYGVPGDRVYVRETTEQRGAGWVYVAGGAAGTGPWSYKRRVRPAIHMPRADARALLPIVAHERVERLQDISEEDARAEGVARRGDGPAAYRAAYVLLWNAINGERGFPWTLNPWVRVVTWSALCPTCHGTGVDSLSNDAPLGGVCQPCFRAGRVGAPQKELARR